MLHVTRAFEKCIARGGSPIGASPITRRAAEEDHPILRLRGVLVNKRLYLKTVQYRCIQSARRSLRFSLRFQRCIDRGDRGKYAPRRNEKLRRGRSNRGTQEVIIHRKCL